MDDNKEQKDEVSTKPCNSPKEDIKDQKLETKDEELDDLLDNALEDFDKVQPPPVSTDNLEAKQALLNDLSQDGAASSATQDAMFEEMFSAEFAEGAQQEFQKAMEQLVTADPDMAKHLEGLTKAAGEAASSKDGPEDFAATLQSTLGSLAANAEKLQGEVSEEDLARMMASGLNLDEGQGGGEGDLDFFPMMQSMMKNLLSKEVLYPSLKDICDKYPDWLTENKDKVPEGEYQRYTKQFDMMKSICTAFDSEKDSDSEEIKNSRFDKIMNLMQEMQELGQPPKEIVGEMSPGVEFDENGMPKMPAGFNPNMSPDQCSIM